MELPRDFEIRDPIHECITCNEAEKALINSPLVQRLKWVAQLSMVNQVYNGGVHSRFSHSLGVMKIAGDYATHLFSPLHLQNDQKQHLIQLARVAGLLHDICHGPFSHAFDHVVYKRIYGVDDGGHDIHRLKLVKCDLLRPYIEKCGIDPGELVEIWGGDMSRTGVDNNLGQYYPIIRNIVEGPLGADRMDFTQRDAYYTGMQHLGTVPQFRIIKNSKIVEIEDVPRLTYSSKCIKDIIRTLDGRLNLYEEVYFHRTSMSATILVEMMMEELCDEFDLVGMTLDPNKFLTLNDHRMFSMVFESKNAKVKELYDMLMNRNLPILVEERQMSFDIQPRVGVGFTTSTATPDLNKDNHVVVKTRAISGISAKKFDEYGIYFYDKAGDIYTCQQLLDERRYTVPVKPYYIMRLYKMPAKEN